MFRNAKDIIPLTQPIHASVYLKVRLASTFVSGVSFISNPQKRKRLLISLFLSRPSTTGETDTYFIFILLSLVYISFYLMQLLRLLQPQSVRFPQYPSSMIAIWLTASQPDKELVWSQPLRMNRPY